MQDLKVGSEFKPGQRVPQSGIYQVVHDRGHKTPHDVTCVFKEPFPPCRECGTGVRFVLKVPAQHVGQNEFFKERYKAVARLGL
jgi:hypothetical protein